MMQFCYLGLYHYTETIYCRLTLKIKNGNDENGLKFEKTSQFFQILEPFLENIARNS